jgi:hypothetical protein
MLEKDELDKLFLKNICKEIMEEVTDFEVTRLSYHQKQIQGQISLQREEGKPL